MKNIKHAIFLLTAIIIASQASCRNKPEEPETGYPLGEIEALLCTGDVIRLSERFNPYDTLHTTVIWFTANPNVVSVSSNGDITAVGAGQTDIFILATLSGMLGVCHTTVTECNSPPLTPPKEGDWSNPSGFGDDTSGMGVVPSGMGVVPSGMGVVPSGMGVVPSGMGVVPSGMSVVPSGMGVVS